MYSLFLNIFTQRQSHWFSRSLSFRYLQYFHVEIAALAFVCLWDEIFALYVKISHPKAAQILWSQNNKYWYFVMSSLMSGVLEGLAADRFSFNLPISELFKEVGFSTKTGGVCMCVFSIRLTIQGSISITVCVFFLTWMKNNGIWKSVLGIQSIP